ncbi:conserved virulence factor C family protein [Alteribacillus iranensis]|uniref:HEAT repeat-containing protein n=1 Tax=Alteribacillus iranensis TaxID=930128 RepID=A0A1I1ZTZ4_9BACI|nr:conserved virulence factor C family protein [Alteribacillus iranensis]SFE35077.1 HEAT repeat-containing protein [Alteribacillus iranensis]
MKIISIEPTPSPNTMKLTLNTTLPSGTSNNYSLKNKDEAPEMIQTLFDIEGIKGVYHVADFMAVERHSKVDWKVILPQVRAAFGEENTDSSSAATEKEEAFGEVQIQLQTFKGIPMQLKLVAGEEEKREGLPTRFQDAAFKAQKDDDNIVMERQWVDHGVRYGNDLDAIGKEVAEEVDAAYSNERLDRLVNKAQHGKNEETQDQPRYIKVTAEMLDDPDWRNRYAALEQMDPSEDDLPVLEKALHDEKASVRRQAVVCIGMVEKPLILPLLRQALQDKSVTVRRTAGDCFSDLGDKAGVPAMVEALKDSSKLVRWRAAMFLYEVGDETAVDALREAADDPEFEVAMQAKMALERIEGGEEAKGSVWKQMTDMLEEKKKAKKNN